MLPVPIAHANAMGGCSLLLNVSRTACLRTEGIYSLGENQVLWIEDLSEGRGNGKNIGEVSANANKTIYAERHDSQLTWRAQKILALQTIQVERALTECSKPHAPVACSGTVRWGGWDCESLPLEWRKV